VARRAYRGPVNDTEMARLLGFYEKERARGSDFDAGVESALTFLLVSPRFLYRIEQDPPGAAPGSAYRISDVELASRLSFFLWSSIPDDELLDVAMPGARTGATRAAGASDAQRRTLEGAREQLRRAVAVPAPRARPPT
jgi:hypothetical protein